MVSITYFALSWWLEVYWSCTESIVSASALTSAAELSTMLTAKTQCCGARALRCERSRHFSAAIVVDAVRSPPSAPHAMEDAAWALSTGCSARGLGG